MDDHKNESFMRQLVDAQGELHCTIASMMPFDRSHVQDVLQETNYALISRAADFDTGKRFLPFAIAFAKNQVLVYFKRKKRENGTLVFDSELIEKCAETALAPREEEVRNSEKALEVCREKLNPRQKRLIAMRYDEGTSVRDMAEQLHTEAASVSKALLRIRQRLGECIRRLCRLDAAADVADARPLTPFESSLVSLLDGGNVPSHDAFLREVTSSRESFSLYLAQIRVDSLLARAARPAASILPTQESSAGKTPFPGRIRLVAAAATLAVLSIGGVFLIRRAAPLEAKGGRWPSAAAGREEWLSKTDGRGPLPARAPKGLQSPFEKTEEVLAGTSAGRNRPDHATQKPNQKEEKMNIAQKTRPIAAVAASFLSFAAQAAENTPNQWWYFKQSEPYLLTNTANYSINSDTFVPTGAVVNSGVRLNCGVYPNGLFTNPAAPLVMDGGTVNTKLLVFGQYPYPFYGRITGGTINVASDFYAANWGAAKVTMEGGALNANSIFMMARVPREPSYLQINGGTVTFASNCLGLGIYGSNILAVTGSGRVDFNRALGLGGWNDVSGNTFSDASLFVTNGGVVRVNLLSSETFVGYTNAVGHLYIADGGIVTNRSNLTLGQFPGTSGSEITVKNGGQLIVGGLFFASRDFNQTHLPLNTTTLIDNGTMSVGNETEIGRFAPLATLIVTNHGSFTSAGEIYVAKGDKSEGKVIVCDGGTMTTPTNFITSFATSDTKSTVIVDNGFVTNQNTFIARSGDSSLFIKNGGKWVTLGKGLMDVANSFCLGQSAGLGEIGLSGGEIILGGPLDTSTQTISFFVGLNSPLAGGIIHGWGAFIPYNVNLVRTPFNLSSVRSTIVADGEGRMHDLSLYKMMLNTTSFTLSPSNGWYAVRQGRLRLPYCKINVDSMGGSAFIGSIPRSDKPDPVRANAVCVTNMGPYQVLFGELYAPDRPDIPAGLATNKYLTVRSVWRIGIAKPAALWKEEKTLADSDTFANSVSMFFRYNTEGYTNSACGLAENAIQAGHTVRLWRYDNASWKCIGKAQKGNSGIIQVDNVKALPLTEDSPHCFGWFALTVSTFRGTVVMLK